MTNNDKFDSWAIVELFGHVTLAGRVTEQTIGGCSFVRLDVPETDGRAAFTKLLGQGAIYSITPVEEAVARAAIARIHPRPVNVFYLSPPSPPSHDDDDHEEEDLD